MLLAPGLLVPVAIVATNSPRGALGWACTIAAVPVGWVLARHAARQALVLTALAFGFATAVVGLLLYLGASYLALLPEAASSSRPETPAGYVIMTIVVLAALTPILGIVVSLVGLGWAVLSRPMLLRAASG